MDKYCTPITLAIADDHKSYRNGLVNTINSNYPDKFKFLFDAGNGKELIEKLEQADELPDIVILDVSMPIMNGYTTMSVINAQWPDLKVLGMSMYNDDYVIIKMLFNGASGFLTKDMAPDEIYTALSTTHETGRYFFGVSPRFSNQTVERLKEYTPNLTEKEMSFLKLCASEMRYEDMAKELGISTRTIHGYRDILFKKFDINSRVGLALFAIRIGLVPNSDVCQ